MRSSWPAAVVLTVTLLALGAQSVSASVSSADLSKFKTVDGTFSKADNIWTTALSHLSANATPAQVSKPSLVFVPAIRTFDTALSKIGFSGKTATDVATVIKLNGQLITDLSSIKSTKTFLSEFAALNPKYEAVQTALGKDLGIPTAEVQV